MLPASSAPRKTRVRLPGSLCLTMLPPSRCAAAHTWPERVAAVPPEATRSASQQHQMALSHGRAFLRRGISSVAPQHSRRVIARTLGDATRVTWRLLSRPAAPPRLSGRQSLSPESRGSSGVWREDAARTPASPCPVSRCVRGHALEPTCLRHMLDTQARRHDCIDVSEGMRSCRRACDTC